MSRLRPSPRPAVVARQLPARSADKGKVIPFPISAGDRRRNTMGARYVECLLSGYWLQFADQSMVFNGVDYVVVTVMTAQSWSADGTPIKPKKHAQLMVSRAELLRALATVHPRERDGD